MLGQQCPNQAAMRIIKVHIDHTDPSGHVLGQCGQIDNLESSWQMQSNFNKLHPLTESIRGTRQIAPQISLGCFKTGAGSQSICEHTETHFRAIPVVPVSQNPSFSIQK